MNKILYRLALLVTVAYLFFVNANLFASETDDRIESSIKQSYVFKNYLKGDTITVLSQDGAVTLTGNVSEDSHKLLAAETVVSQPGVKTLDNQLQVQGDFSSLNEDARLSVKVLSSLMFYRSLSDTEITVIAKEGNITLRGEATSMAQKDLATEYTKDIDGVKEVKNEMTVALTAQKPGEKTMGDRVETLSESMDDASITALVKSTLLYHRSTSALTTTVETKEGMVTLSGKAGNGAEKDLATKYASDVHGVKAVVNNMIIEGPQPKISK